MKHKLYEAMRKGHQILAAEHDSTPPETALRGGNSGCFVGESQIAGACPKSAVLRYFGIQKPTSFDQQLMFDAGVNNEDAVTAMLGAAGVYYRCEENWPTKWEAGGIPVTGRPDIVVGQETGPLEKDFIPEYGVEEKLLCSVWSVMKNAHFIVGGGPKTNHVIQAAHYSWQNDYLPWVIHYSSRVNWAIPFYAQRPSKKNPEGYFTEDHRALRRDDKGIPYTFLPFVSLYDLTWVEDTLLIDNQLTAISGEGIRKYYEYLAACIKSREVPKIQSLYNHKGELIPIDKNEAVRYYDFIEAREDSGFDTWLDDCREIAKENEA